MIKAGIHKARASEAAVGKANNGTEYIGVWFDILDDDEETTGERVRWSGYLTEKTEDRTWESLAHCGWDGSDFDNFTGITGRVVSITVEHDTGNDGKRYASVAWVNNLTKRGPTVRNELDDAERASFAERMRGSAAAVVDAIKAEQKPQTDDDGSDIPF